MNLDVNYMLTQVSERFATIKELVEHRRVFTSQTEQETFDLLLKKEVAELNDLVKLLASMQQQLNTSGTST